MIEAGSIQIVVLVFIYIQYTRTLRRLVGRKYVVDELDGKKISNLREGYIRHGRAFLR